MLAVALEMDYEAEAIEICMEDCETVSKVLNLKIHHGDFLDYETDTKYDILIMGDVLEHITRPVEALKKAVHFLSETGVLWLSTPNYNSGYTRMMKFQDAMWNQKNHFTYFSYECLLPILEDLGFTVVKYDVSNRFLGSMELYLKQRY